MKCLKCNKTIDPEEAKKIEDGHICQEPDEAGTGISNTRKGTGGLKRERASRGASRETKP